MAKANKSEKSGKGDGNLATVERLDAYVSIGTKSGLGVWSNKVTWTSLFGYVPHFVEQLNTHRGVLEFLGGTFRDKKNGKLINPPQAFFNHQMEQMRGTQMRLSQEMSALGVRLQEEQRKREIAEHRAADLESQLNEVQRFLLSQGGPVLDQLPLPRRDYGGSGYGAPGGYSGRQGSGFGGINYKSEAPGSGEEPYLRLPPVDGLATRTNEFQHMAATLLAQSTAEGAPAHDLAGLLPGPSGANGPMGDMGKGHPVDPASAATTEHYMRLLSQNDIAGGSQQPLIQQLQMMQRQGGSGGPAGGMAANGDDRGPNPYSPYAREDADAAKLGGVGGGEGALEGAGPSEYAAAGGAGDGTPYPAHMQDGRQGSPTARGSSGNGNMHFRRDGGPRGGPEVPADLSDEQATAYLVQKLLHRQQWEAERAAGLDGGRGPWSGSPDGRGTKRPREEDPAPQ